MKVKLDIPIFPSPTEAWGRAEGSVDLPDLPSDGDWLTLPFDSAELTSLGMPSPMLVWCVTTLSDGSRSILLDGVVAEDASGARRIAQILEVEFGFLIDEYEWN